MANIGSIMRSIHILDLYIKGEYELSPSEVSKKTGISMATTFRTMSTLCKANILVQSANRGKYRLGPKILDLSRAYMSYLNLEDVALPHMEKLNAKTNETIGLYIRENSEAVCLRAITGHKSIQRVINVGMRSPIYAGSPSKTLLAYLPDDEIHKILQSIKMEKITDLTQTNISKIVKDLRAVRKKGYSITKGENTKLSFAVSAPIRSISGEVVAALSIVGVTLLLTDQKEREYPLLVKQTADFISHDIGYLS